MKNTTYQWTTPDGTLLYAQSWTPEKDKKKLILLIHGLGEHSSRYESWVSLFTEKGYSVLTMDLRGHGRSSGRKGHIRSLSVLLDDIDLIFNKADELFPGYKKILYGHSMGGTLVLNHVIRRNKPLDAVIATSPWLKLTNEPSSVMLVLVGIMKAFLPSLSVHNQIDPAQISHDPEVVRNYGTDPLMYNRISLGMLHEIIQAGQHALKNVYKINYPLLLMHGTADAVTSPKASEEFARNTSKMTRLKLWENQYHELHNELIRKEVFNYIIKWLAEYKL